VIVVQLAATGTDIEARHDHLSRALSHTALFAAGLSALQAVALIAARGQLPTDLGGIGVALAAGMWPLLGPAVLRQHMSGARSDAVLWLGVASVALLLAPFLLMMLGVVGEAALYAGALALVLFTLRPVFLRPSMRLLPWLGLLLVAGIAFAVQIGGSKYVNFFADQLALFGRTDGDVFSHGAITNSLRYFGVPSMAIDGIRQLHYHFGVNLLAAALAEARGLDATYALTLLKSLILVPLLFSSVANAALLLAGESEKIDGAGREASALLCAWWTTFFVALLPITGLGNILVNSDSMLLGGILLVISAPSLMALWMHGRNGAGAASWIFWILMVPVMGICKISVGTVWLGIVGYSALRTYGLRRIVTWLIGLGALAAFAAAFWLASGPSEMGATWFGQPFYVERGWAEGDYLLPIQRHVEWLLAVIGLWLVSRGRHTSGLRGLIELLAVTALGANLPGLLMQIPGGDAVYFILVSDWLALPVAVACGAAFIPLESVSAARRIVVAAASLVVAGLLIWSAVSPTKTGWRHFLAANALLRTGDPTYYEDDHRKPVREDAERAWREIDRDTLLSGPRAEPPAQSLVAALAALRTEHGATAALYVAPDVGSFWSYVRDCDVSNLLPITVAGVQMIDGSYPDQAKCRQDIGRRGYADIPEVRPARSDPELCDMARDRGIHTILSIGDLADRARDRLLACGLQ
jgi:hypothetical protein